MKRHECLHCDILDLVADHGDPNGSFDPEIVLAMLMNAVVDICSMSGTEEDRDSLIQFSMDQIPSAKRLAQGRRLAMVQH